MGTGSRPHPYTDPEVHGEVTESWTTTITGNVLTSQIIVTRPSINHRSVTDITMVDNYDTLEFTEVSRVDGRPETQTEHCVLLRHPAE